MFKFWYTLFNLYYSLIHFFYERPRGLDFFRMTDPYGITSDNIFYQTKSYRQLKKVMKGYVEPDARLLDVGCGKGHFLYCARLMGFQYLDGIEYDGDILEIAQLNMMALGERGIGLIHADAAEFTRLDMYEVIYLFNPFCTNVMRRFVRNLEKSLLRNPRRLRVIYANPAEHATWDRSKFFELTETRRLVQLPRTIGVYYYLHDPYAYEEKRFGEPDRSFRDILDRNLAGRQEEDETDYYG